MLNKKLLIAAATLAIISFSSGAQAGQVDNNVEGISTYTTFAKVSDEGQKMDKMSPSAGADMTDKDHRSNARYNQD